MNLFRVMKLKFYYMINKNTLLTFIFAFLLIVFILVLEIINLDQKRADEELINEYLINSYVYIKMFTVILSIYLFSYSISFKNDFLIYLLLPLNVKKEKNLIACIFLNILLILFLYIWIIIFFAYLALNIHTFVVNMEIIHAFLNIIALSYIFGLYAMLLMQIINNNFSFIIMIVIYIISNNLIDYKEYLIIKIINLCFPFLDINCEYMYNDLYLIILIVILIILNLIIYHFRDLNF